MVAHWGDLLVTGLLAAVSCSVRMWSGIYQGGIGSTWNPEQYIPVIVCNFSLFRQPEVIQQMALINTFRCKQIRFLGLCLLLCHSDSFSVRLRWSIPHDSLLLEVSSSFATMRVHLFFLRPPESNQYGFLDRCI